VWKAAVTTHAKQTARKSVNAFVLKDDALTKKIYDLLQLISFMSFQQQVAQLMQDCDSWSATKNKFTKHCIIIKTFL
jgi:hypothetical protein